MISSLRGQLIYTDAQSAVIECSGIGFKCFASLKTLAALPKTGNEAFVYTYMAVKEDAVDLYGFAKSEELDCFKLIISVNGWGAKMAIALLSEYTPDQISYFILSGDSKALSKPSGVGPKLAQRMVLELKDKISKGALDISEETLAVQNITKSTNATEAIAALVSLGFSQSEATASVAKLDPALPVDELIKGGLKNLSR